MVDINDAYLELLTCRADDLLDESSNGNDLTNSGVTFNSGDKQQGTHSSDFERSENDVASITDGSQSGLDITGDITFGGHFKPETMPSSGEYTLVSKYKTSGNQRSYMLAINSSDRIVLRFASAGTSATTLTSSSTLSAGTWYHIVGELSGTTMRIYLDGSSDNSKSHTGGIHSGSADFYLGDYDGAATNYDGLMNEIFVFSRALGSTDVSDIYNNGIQSAGQPMQLRGAQVPGMRQWQPGRFFSSFFRTKSGLYMPRTQLVRA